jgi:CheY-like chemotaxis protein
MLNTLAASAGALNQVLVDLLDFSRLESGTLEISAEPFRVADVVKDSVAPYEDAARAKGIDVVVDVADLAEARVVGDPGRLRQILSNLVSNALKFTEQGRITLRAARAETHDAYRFTVEDTGPGFDAADAERLFARFEQADSSTTRKHGGLGLGLSICRQLADLMGGSISAKTEPGVGATFTVVLPFASAQESGEPAADHGDVGEACETPLRVLVTDDNPTNRMVAELIMNSIGAVVVCAENGQEAIVVLMDLQMPVMDGLTAIRAIRQREAAKGLPRVPVVVVSANVMREQRDESSAAGADDHLGKPIRAEELIAAVVRVIQASELQSDAA